ncbi:hypothetical protein CVT25_009753 [Psilocybe cyanescens]|uniref:Uncharacterized protein n=1 Tax=Psilocybe cyanescens TaxID=93625 RepID=A0A409VU95_PSICY|nr:hypothetical protein CVT25_009753 [Psilocybe cyanescens]
MADVAVYSVLSDSFMSSGDVFCPYIWIGIGGFKSRKGQHAHGRRLDAEGSPRLDLSRTPVEEQLLKNAR